MTDQPTTAAGLNDAADVQVSPARPEPTTTAAPQPHEVVVQTDGLYRAVIDAWYAVEKELDVEWMAHNPIQGEATYKVFAYRIALATVERLIAEGWRPLSD